LGFNFCSHRADYDHYASLPDWAQATLAKHAGDKRPVKYTPQQLEAADTYDELWNAAQRQLVRDGRLHNYLRMLWGKKVLEWSPSPEEALQTLIHLNNKYAVDGRDPNSYSGILWIFGRYDRPWGPERPIFGTIRYMSSQNTAKKLNVKGYLERYGAKGATERRRAKSKTIFPDQ
jgi:deoxyribodipyrimidine photo-lyase